MSTVLKAIYQRLVHSVVESAEDVEPKLVLFGLFGVVGFPLYYAIWTYLFPQPYDSILVRGFCAVVAIPALFIKYWPRDARRYVPAYWYFSILLCAPFFFTFMLLQNQVNTVWSGSFIVSVCMTLLAFDLVNAILMVAIGMIAALLVYTLINPLPIPWERLLEQVPVYLFTLVTTGLFRRELARERRAKIAAAMALGGHIAHELRTPLMTIEAASEILGSRLPGLLELDRMHAANSGDEPIVGRERDLITQAPTVIAREVEHAHMIIDLALANAGFRPLGADESRVLDIIWAVSHAVQRYPFKNPAQRDWITIAEAPRFTAEVIPLLYDHLIFNLLKNSIYAIQAAGRGEAGEICIWATTGPRMNRLHFRDNGQGISLADQHRVFNAFFSNKPNGTGLGLHFCRSVMRRFGGDIRCRSLPGAFTEFILEFPVA
jgi:two-component system, CAI-1 autoinducer sensor kinase/phosphatase CqsS